MQIGYTTGTFDMFHVGHLNILRAAKSMCDKLIVGVSADELTVYKNKRPIIPIEQRIEIVRNIRYVDIAIPQRSLDKVEAYKKLKYNILFVGDDWYEDKKWKKWEKELHKHGVVIVYFPRTKSISSTIIKERIKNE